MVILARKMFVMMAALLFDSRPVLGWFLSMLVIMVALVAQGMASPYTSGELNFIEFCSLMFTLLIMTSGMAFRAENLEALKTLQEEAILDSSALKTFDAKPEVNPDDSVDPVQARQMSADAQTQMISHQLQMFCLMLVAIMGTVSFLTATETAWDYASDHSKQTARMISMYTITCTCIGFLVGRAVDTRGFSDAQGIDCFAATLHHGYTAEEQIELVRSCPIACGLNCTSSVDTSPIVDSTGSESSFSEECVDDPDYHGPQSRANLTAGPGNLDCADWKYDYRALCALLGLSVGILIAVFATSSGYYIFCCGAGRGKQSKIARKQDLRKPAAATCIGGLLGWMLGTYVGKVAHNDGDHLPLYENELVGVWICIMTSCAAIQFEVKDLAKSLAVLGLVLCSVALMCKENYWVADGQCEKKYEIVLYPGLLCLVIGACAYPYIHSKSTATQKKGKSGENAVVDEMSGVKSNKAYSLWPPNEGIGIDCDLRFAHNTDVERKSQRARLTRKQLSSLSPLLASTVISAAICVIGAVKRHKLKKTGGVNLKTEHPWLQFESTLDMDQKTLFVKTPLYKPAEPALYKEMRKQVKTIAADQNQGLRWEDPRDATTVSIFASDRYVCSDGLNHSVLHISRMEPDLNRKIRNAVDVKIKVPTLSDFSEGLCAAVGLSVDPGQLSAQVLHEVRAVAYREPRKNKDGGEEAAEAKPSYTTCTYQLNAGNHRVIADPFMGHVMYGDEGHKKHTRSSSDEGTVLLKTKDGFLETLESIMTRDATGSCFGALVFNSNRSAWPGIAMCYIGMLAHNVRDLHKRGITHGSLRPDVISLNKVEMCSACGNARCLCDFSSEKLDGLELNIISFDTAATSTTAAAAAADNKLRENAPWLLATRSDTMAPEVYLTLLEHLVGTVAEQQKAANDESRKSSKLRRSSKQGDRPTPGAWLDEADETTDGGIMSDWIDSLSAERGTSGNGKRLLDELLKSARGKHSDQEKLKQITWFERQTADPALRQARDLWSLGIIGLRFLFVPDKRTAIGVGNDWPVADDFNGCSQVQDDIDKELIENFVRLNMEFPPNTCAVFSKEAVGKKDQCLLRIGDGETTSQCAKRWAGLMYFILPETVEKEQTDEEAAKVPPQVRKPFAEQMQQLFEGAVKENAKRLGWSDDKSWESKSLDPMHDLRWDEIPVQADTAETTSEESDETTATASIDVNDQVKYSVGVQYMTHEQIKAATDLGFEPKAWRQEHLRDRPRHPQTSVPLAGEAVLDYMRAWNCLLACLQINPKDRPKLATEDATFDKPYLHPA